MFSIYSRIEYAEKLEAAQKEIMRLKTTPTDADRIKELEKENAELRLQLDGAYKQRDDLFSCLHRRHVEEGIAEAMAAQWGQVPDV